MLYNVIFNVKTFKILRWTSIRSEKAHKSCLQWDKTLSELKKSEYFLIENHWRDKVLAKSENHGGVATNGKKYILSMFPYPSGNLHMGHVRVYTISDCISRYYALLGYKVFHPMGWDAFGLPAENAAIERGENPATWTKRNIDVMREQLLKLGCKFNWEAEFATCDPSYYRWTQWIFLQMYKQGLVYRRKSLVNWDPVDCTVLAKEQIDANGKSWRSGAVVENKVLDQWFVKTTKFAKSLYDNLEKLDHWHDIVDFQRNWLGDCSVRKFSFQLSDDSGKRLDDFIDVGVKNPSDLNEASFLLVDSSHELWSIFPKLVAESNGVKYFQLKALNPINGLLMPIIERGASVFEQFQLIRLGSQNEIPKYADILSKIGEQAIVSNKKQLSADDILAKATKENWGGHISSYRLDDWVVSRQRYWGTPIPIIHCQKCGTVPVPDADLPVKLPEMETISVKTSSLASADKSWLNVECPKCKSKARRETDTLDTFFDSSWYYLRYLDSKNDKSICDVDKSKNMMPVDVYVGGKEHAVLHLYFARFVCHFLNQIGVSPVAEPFDLLLPQGYVQGLAYRKKNTGQYLNKINVEKLANGELVEIETKEAVEECWEKMSKSKHNGVNPLDVFAEFGSDMTRLMMVDHYAPKEARQWTTNSFIPMSRWLNRVSYLVNNYVLERKKLNGACGKVDEEKESTLRSDYNRCVQKVSHYFRLSFTFNSGIAELIKLTNTLRKQPLELYGSSKQFERCLHSLVIMMSPFAPSIAAEFWSALNSVESKNNDFWLKEMEVWEQRWPLIDEDAVLRVAFEIDGDVIGSEMMDQRELPKITLEKALELANKNEKLKKKLYFNAWKIVDCRMETEEFFGIRVRLTVEPTGEEPPKEALEAKGKWLQKQIAKREKKLKAT